VYFAYSIAVTYSSLAYKITNLEIIRDLFYNMSDLIAERNLIAIRTAGLPALLALTIIRLHFSTKANISEAEQKTLHFIQAVCYAEIHKPL
jgi:hypothetical protein